MQKIAIWISLITFSGPLFSQIHNAIEVDSVTGVGLSIQYAGEYGLSIGSAGLEGILMGFIGGSAIFAQRVGTPSAQVFPSEPAGFKSGMIIGGAEGYGFFAGRSDLDGIYLKSSGWHGLRIGDTDSSGVVIEDTYLHGVQIRKAGGFGIHATGSLGAAYLNGKVGIGTASPRRQIHSHSVDPGSNFMKITNATTGSNSSDGLDIGVESGGDAIVWMKSNYALKFATNNSSRMYISNDGKVGVGTNNPAAQLDVNGDIQWAPVTSYISVAPAMFEAGKSEFIYSFLSEGLRTFDGSTDTYFYAPLQIPQGAILVNVIVSYLDDNGSGNYTFTFRRRLLTDNSCSYETLGTVTPNSDDNNCKTATIPNLSGTSIDNSTYAYAIRISVPDGQNGPMYIKGARIEYTINRPY